MENNPVLRPSVADISEQLKVMKNVCGKRKNRDGMDPKSWLSEINQASLSALLQVCLP